MTSHRPQIQQTRRFMPLIFRRFRATMTIHYPSGGLNGATYMSAAGKALEGFIRDALAAWSPALWHHNFDNVGESNPKLRALRPGDKLALLPPHGRGCLIECKETKSGSTLPFSEVKPHQEISLYKAARVGAYAIVATAFKCRGRWRVFLVWYTDFAHLRRTSGRASIPLDDAGRPACLVELQKLRSQAPGGVWDLQSGIQALESLDAAPLHQMTPTRERRGF